MPAPRQPAVIDGLTSVRLLRDRSGPAARGAVEGPAGWSRVGHTVAPTVYGVICYECGFAFTVRGRLHAVSCPKCRKALDTETHRLEGAWSGRLRTLGMVEIAPDARLEAVEITAGRCRVAGALLSGRLTVTGLCVLAVPLDLAAVTLQTVDLAIESGTTMAFEQLACRDLDVAGRVDGRFQCGGCLTVRAGGWLTGAVVAARWRVEADARIEALIQINAVTTAGSGEEHNGG